MQVLVRVFLLALLSAPALSSCASRGLVDAHGTNLVGASPVYTLVNLHPDEKRARLYSVNYQQAGLIPLCSEVLLLHLDRDELRFRVVKTQREYEYVYHDVVREPFDRHLLRVFGSHCSVSEREALDATDRAGIAAGKALAGMSKRGVVLAIGYPPPHTTPDLEANAWVYWKSRFDRFSVLFDAHGRVIAVQD